MAYHVVLEEFEGPLDLLLYLIGKAQLDIIRIHIADITEQYMAYMTDVQEMDMERSSAFIAMAARLLEIKSARLLPREDTTDGQEEPDDEQLLKRQLALYSQYKEICEQLRLREEENKLLFFRQPEELFTENDYDIVDAQAKQLSLALQRLLSQRALLRQQDEDLSRAQSVERDNFTIQEQIFRIRARLSKQPQIRFEEFFEGQTSRAEVVVTFIALLELMKLGKVEVSQVQADGQIMITALA